MRKTIWTVMFEGERLTKILLTLSLKRPSNAFNVHYVYDTNYAQIPAGRVACARCNLMCGKKAPAKVQRSSENSNCIMFLLLSR